MFFATLYFYTKFICIKDLYKYAHVLNLFFYFPAAAAITNPPITGTTPPAVPCPDSLCKGKADGNFDYRYHGKYNSHYFLQCSGGLAYCQACFPLSLEFSQDCNQCLYSKHGMFYQAFIFF